MSKIKKLRYLREEIIKASEQLEVLTNKIYESEKHSEIMVLSSLSNAIAKKISKLNKQIGITFKL